MTQPGMVRVHHENLDQVAPGVEDGAVDAVWKVWASTPAKVLVEAARQVEAGWRDGVWALSIVRPVDSKWNGTGMQPSVWEAEVAVIGQPL